MPLGEDQPSHGEFVTWREAVSMFVSRSDFDKFATRMESKIDSLLADRLPRWAWLVVGFVVAFVAPLAAALFAHWLTGVK